MAICRNVGLFQVKCCIHKPSQLSNFHHIFKNSFFSSLKPWMEKVGKKMEADDHYERMTMMVKESSMEIVDVFTDFLFEFLDQPLLPSQCNFGPIEERGEAVIVDDLQGNIPVDFPQGVYIRNGPNPLFGGLKSTKSIFGRSSHIWVEGEGMLHALYFKKQSDGKWSISYNNMHVETDTFKLEKQRNKPSFLPAIEGDSPAILSAYLLNLMRFGKVNKMLSNTSVFEHSGKLYAASENHLPQEIDIQTLNTLGSWDVNGSWTRPFTAHPKKAPGSGELVTMGIDAKKPFFELGVVSADGKKLFHKADLKYKRCTLSHDIGVTMRYNVIMDFPLTIDLKRLMTGGPLIKYEKNGYARIGVMPRYGDSNSVRWFEVEPCSVFHIINSFEDGDEIGVMPHYGDSNSVRWFEVESCSVFHIINSFEDGDEVVIWACRASKSLIPGPDLGLNKFSWFSSGFKRSNKPIVDLNSDESFFSRAYEWRLNMKTGEVEERYLTGTQHSIDFPLVNESFVGVKNKYGYTQVVDLHASSIAGMAKYGGLAKLHFEKEESRNSKGEDDHVHIDYHKLPEKTFCSGAVFVPKQDSQEEDDGWLISFVHDEQSHVSQVHIIDAKNFTCEPVVKITLPTRVSYGFHGAFISTTS